MNELPQKVILSDEQEAIIEDALAGKSLLITGSAGTGKSTLLREMIQRMNGRLPVTASTGIAAVNIGGVTLHSWAGIGLADEDADKLAKKILDRQEPRDRIRNFNRLAIDEISMISADLLNKLDRVFRIVRKVDQPFGRMQLILFGDFLQLPPVVKTADELRAGRFAFQSQAWRDAKIEVRMLTKVFRQSDETFARILNQVRVGDVTTEVRTVLGSRLNQTDPDPAIRPVIVHTHNVDVDRENAEQLSKLELPEETYVSFDSGRPGPLAVLQKNCLAPELLRLRKGAQVMLLKNHDPGGGLANGSVGIVEEFTKALKLPIVRFTNGRTLQIEQARFEMKDCGTVVASRQQLPLRLAWAITAHKSQGMTLDKIEVHLGRCFEDGQAYVALSRAKSLAGLFIASGDRRSIRAAAEAVEFYRNALQVPDKEKLVGPASGVPAELLLSSEPVPATGVSRL